MRGSWEEEQLGRKEVREEPWGDHEEIQVAETARAKALGQDHAWRVEGTAWRPRVAGAE